MMIRSYDESVEIKCNPNCHYITNHPFRVLIKSSPDSEKTNALLNLIKHQRPDDDQIYLFVKDPFKSKYQLLISGRKKEGSKHEKTSKAFFDFSQTIDDVSENLEGYNSTKNGKVLIVFADMIAVMEANKKVSHLVRDLFMRGRKLNTENSSQKTQKTHHLFLCHNLISK